MTSQKSYFKPGVWLNMQRRGWPSTLLFAIILFFAMPVFLMLFTPRISWSSSGYNSAEAIMIITAISRVFTCFMAFFSGIVSFRIMQNRVSAYYFHSLPVSREAHFLHIWLSGPASYAAALLANTLICQIIIITNRKLEFGESAALWQGAGQNLIFFMLFFSVVILAGTLCGTSPVQFVISLAAIYILPALCISMSALVASYLPFFNTENLTLETLRRLSFGISVFTGLESVALSAVENLIYIFIIITATAAGMVIFRFRTAERAGLPFIYPRFGSVVKYILMIPAMILSGELFGRAFSNGNQFWLVFGYACGALLTFMLMNVISYKNAKAMFRNLRGFAIFAAASALVITLFTFDTFGINNYIPADGAIKSVTLDISDLPVLTFESEEGIAAAAGLVRAAQDCKLEANEKPADVLYDSSEYYIDVGENSYYYYHNDNYIINASFETVFGINIEKRYYITIYDKEKLDSALTALAECPEFEEAYLRDFVFTANTTVSFYENDIFDFRTQMNLSGNQISALKKAAEDRIDWSYFQNRTVGSIMIRDVNEERNYVNYHYAYYPVFYGDNGIYKIYEELYNTEDVKCGSVIVVNTESGEYLTCTGEEEKKLVLAGRAARNVNIMTKTDNKYVIIITDAEYYETGDFEIRDEREEALDIKYSEDVVIPVLSGGLPQFVIDAIG